MMKKIIDEFTDLNISRQRKSQLRNKRDGLCVKCGSAELVTKEYCEYHARQQSLQNARYRGIITRKVSSKWGKRGE